MNQRSMPLIKDENPTKESPYILYGSPSLNRKKVIGHMNSCRIEVDKHDIACKSRSCVIIMRFSYHANLGPEVGIACKSRVYIYECKYRSQLERSFMENLDQ